MAIPSSDRDRASLVAAWGVSIGVFAVFAIDELSGAPKLPSPRLVWPAYARVIIDTGGLVAMLALVAAFAGAVTVAFRGLRLRPAASPAQLFAAAQLVALVTWAASSATAALLVVVAARINWLSELRFRDHEREVAALRSESDFHRTVIRTLIQRWRRAETAPPRERHRTPTVSRRTRS